MSLVGKVGRRRPRARIAMGALYALLTLGALTTLYPFALMVSTGLKGPTDQNDGKLVPAYLQGDADLQAKFLDDKYAGDGATLASTRAASVGADPADVPAYRAFLAGLDPSLWRAGFGMQPTQVSSRLRARYQAWLRDRYRQIEAVNRAYLEEAVAFQTVDPPAEMLERASWSPPATRKYAEWLEFKRTLPAEFRVPVRLDRLFQAWAAGRWQNQFGSVPAELKGSADRFESLVLPAAGPWRTAFDRAARPARYRDGAAEAAWARHVGRPSARLPIAQEEADHVAAQAPALRREFAGRNYAYVLDYILLNGRAVANTALFCLLAIATQLVVNPLAAYALSRYPVRQSGKILIFLLATMAFPAEVAMIPSFLLLKDLGLLNTFAALVLPSAASGYMIFLLKGFFDSLPQELFEAGQLDGAREWTMLGRIALPLSRPVLGYLALMAFMGAYGAFLYAFLVVQDQRMWTLMVWVYQLQNSAPRAVMMAALTLVALPTLVVFLLTQRVIVRGIVLPGER